VAHYFKRFTVGLAIVAAALLLVAGPGTRLDLWAYGTGFLLMRIAFFTGLAAAGLALLLAVIPKTRAAGVLPLVAALVIGLGTAWVPWSGLQKARSLPFIHDISTDTQNPPAFVAILPLRADAPNPPEYAGEEAAQQQREGYPDIQPLQLAMPPQRAFERALAIADEMGWEIVAAEASAGRIEATDTTFWFGFKDDVVIRVEPAADGSRLDIRSKSRVGRSDVGANAARIREFLAALQR
jgi:uncharacterized protein (DUF1499 family)